MGRLIAQNTRHIQKTPIMTEQYLWEEIVKDTGCLEDIFTDTNSINHNRVFNPYTAGTQVDTYHSDKQKDNTSDEQIKWVGAGTNKIDHRQDHYIGYEEP